MSGKKIEDGSNSIILHQFARAYKCPNMSPFPIKLETYLRVNKIQYKNDFEKPMGPSGKSPWMTYNGQEIPDSQVCIDFLNEKLNIDMNSHLTKEEKAIAKAFRHLFEDHIYWTEVYIRWVKDKGSNVNKFMPFAQGFKGKLMLTMASRRLKGQCYNQGTGRHSEENILKMQGQAVTSFLDFLGSKKYLMGDTICEEDCIVFAFIVQIVYHTDPKVVDQLMEAYPNMKAYMDRIKNEYWPDWDECLTPMKK